MKKLTLMTLLTVAMAFPAMAGEKELPPGLQKKDKLPPGIAKRGITEERTVVVVTNTVTNTVVVPSAPAPAAPPAAPAPVVNVAKAPTTASPASTPTLRQLRVDITKHARTINTLDNNPATRQAGLESIAKETGVSVPTLQMQHRQHQGIGTAGLLMANVIAVQTKRPAGNFLRQAAEGKPWERIAADNGVNLEDLDAKLAHLETAMRNVK